MTSRCSSSAGKVPSPERGRRSSGARPRSGGSSWRPTWNRCPADRQYQLWVFVDGKPIDAGVFDVDPSGKVLFESKDLAAVRTAENFAVTVEPRGGRPQPSGPIVLIGSPSPAG